MVFIDGNNFEAALTALYGSQQRVDYLKLAEYVAARRDGMLQRIYYYTAVGNLDKAKTAATKSFIEHLIKRFQNV